MTTVDKTEIETDAEILANEPKRGWGTFLCVTTAFVGIFIAGNLSDTYPRIATLIAIGGIAVAVARFIECSFSPKREHIRAYDAAYARQRQRNAEKMEIESAERAAKRREDYMWLYMIANILFGLLCFIFFLCLYIGFYCWLFFTFGPVVGLLVLILWVLLKISFKISVKQEREKVDE